MTREEKLKAAAKALMLDDPKEYEGETLEEVCAQLECASDAFLDHAIEWFPIPTNYQ